MAKYKSQSIHEYEGSNVLINKFDERDPEKLNQLEALYTGRRMLQLQNKPMYGAFGLKHLQKIHKFIFQDIYPFAGELRQEQIEKGTTPFAHPLHLDENARSLFKDLKNEKFLKGLDKEKFSERASHYLTEINILHPFREGNGRTQREFLRTLGLKNGFEIDWSRMDENEMLQASIKSVFRDNQFVDIFKQVIVNDEPSLELIKEFNSLSKKNELEL
ncbi:Fic/DOC family protein (plasmid) [Niallia taxi]|uniref:Fic/DOC family protein n=1 Tax=Niallia TaxID=2837506 RepID=UPI0015F54998|nr:Fic family protein [Niallia taxi]MED4057215.1 Fic family protein [Niallia taxi]MED4122188.1 Fic family protein [Niallia taxi]